MFLLNCLLLFWPCLRFLFVGTFSMLIHSLYSISPPKPFCVKDNSNGNSSISQGGVWMSACYFSQFFFVLNFSFHVFSLFFRFRCYLVGFVHFLRIYISSRSRHFNGEHFSCIEFALQSENERTNTNWKRNEPSKRNIYGITCSCIFEFIVEVDYLPLSIYLRSAFDDYYVRCS